MGRPPVRPVFKKLAGGFAGRGNDQAVAAEPLRDNPERLLAGTWPAARQLAGMEQG